MLGWYTGRTQDPLFEGETIALGGQLFTVPRFKLKQWIALAPMRNIIAKADDPLADTVLIAELNICAVALQRNYPDMKADDLAENLDPEDFNPLITLIMKLNNPQGEAKASAIPANGTTGAASETKIGE